MFLFLVAKAISVTLIKVTNLLFRKTPSIPPADEFIATLERDEIYRSSRLLDAEKLLELRHMRRFQEMESAACWLGEAPLCILFISHRWITPTHPDPEGEHLKAIQFLLSAIKKLASIHHLPLEERAKVVKTLKIHGYLQAARIVSKLVEENGTVDSSILSRIGIWVDFMCLPQKDAFEVDDRTPKELALFKQGLRGLPPLIASCDYIVSIRRDGDDYMERAWCLSELCFSSFKHRKNVIVLRQDILGQPIDESLLRTEQKVESEFLASLRRALGKWENGQQNLGEMNLDFHYADLDIVEEDIIKSHEDIVEGSPNLKQHYPTPLFTTGRPPLIFRNQGDFLMTIRQSLVEAPPRNVALLVMRTMKECGMSCYDINDYIRCGLHILFARMRGHAGWNKFFNDCLVRLSNGEPLVLGDVAKLDMSGADYGDSVTYRFETDQTLLSLHAKATDIWKQQHLQEDPKKIEFLLEAMLRQLGLLDQAYERTPDLGLMHLSDLVTNAMEFAKIECEGSKLEMGLALLYANCQCIVNLQYPDARKLTSFLLNCLERAQDDQTLRVSNYRNFECCYVDNVTEEIMLNSLRHMIRSENLKLDLTIAATGLPVFTVG